MRVPKLVLRLLPVSLFAGVACFAQTPPPTWTATASMADARQNGCAVRLNDGRILVSGGTGIAGDLLSTEFYLAEGSFTSGPPLNIARTKHTCTLLTDGRVLVAGGDSDGSGSVELFDPTLGNWQLVQGAGTSRREHTATLLTDGRVLLTGGTATEPLDSVEIFDPQTGILISADPALDEARGQHAAVLLPDGRVLIVGGKGANGSLASTEIFDPRDFSVIAGPPLAVGRAGLSATLLHDGRVLVAGGSDGTSETDSAEILDAAQTKWTTLPVRLNTARRDHLAILVPGNGGVLLAGGMQKGSALGATELFLPVENQFLLLGALTLPRTGLAGSAVDAGVILAAGGGNDKGPQSACGILLLPALTFSKSLYHPGDAATVSGSGFPGSTAVTFSLDIVTATGAFAGKDRLLTTSITTQAASLSNIRVGFGPLPAVMVQPVDAGRSYRLIANIPSGSVVATAMIRVPTSLFLTLPTSILEGLNATLLAQVSRPASLSAMTGSVAISSNPDSSTAIQDGTSNTILVGDRATTTTPVNTSGTSVLVQAGLTNLSAGVMHVQANYSGDTSNDPTSASGNFTVVSKTPTIELTSDTVVAHAGVPFNITATVRAAGSVTAPRIFNGTTSFFQSGFMLASMSGKNIAGSNPQELQATLAFTPLTLNPVSFSASYSGDTSYRGATTSFPLNLTVKLGPASLHLDTFPTTFQCGQPSNFSATLTFPPAIGLSSRQVTLIQNPGDGSTRVVPASGMQLTPSATTPGTATATFSAVLPVLSPGVILTFSGDALIQPAQSQLVSPTLQLGSVTVTFQDPPSTATNPATFTAVVTSSSCGVPPDGTVEFLDGGTSLAVVSLGRGAASLGQPGLSFNNASLTISRPAGTHNLQLRYSGDSLYTAAMSAVTPVIFQ